MIDTLLYHQLPHPIDRAHRAREVIGYALRHGHAGLLRSFVQGTPPNYTFGIIDHAANAAPHIVRPWQLELMTAGAGSLATMSVRLAGPAPGPSMAPELAGAVWLHPETYLAAVVPVTDRRLAPAQSRLQ